MVTIWAANQLNKCPASSFVNMYYNLMPPHELTHTQVIEIWVPGVGILTEINNLSLTATALILKSYYMPNHTSLH